MTTKTMAIAGLTALVIIWIIAAMLPDYSMLFNL